MEMVSGESACEAVNDPSVVDIDLEMGDFIVSPTPQGYLDLDRTCMLENLKPSGDAATDLNKHTGFEVETQSSQFLVQNGLQGNSLIFNPFQSINIREPFSGGEAVCIVETDQFCEVPSESSARCVGGKKSENKSESINESMNRRKPVKTSGFDLTSLKILRKSRSSYAKPARTSIWGSQVQILRDYGTRVRLELKGRNGKKRNSSRNRSGKNSNGRKATSARLQTVHASSRNSNLPMRPISLKIKFGKRDCVIGNQDVNTGSAEKEISELFENGCRIRQNMSGDDASVFAMDKGKIILSDVSAKCEHIDAKSEGDAHQATCLKILNLVASTENQFSDVGTSPDSEVINSVPDASQCEKGLSKCQDTSRMLSASASTAAISNSIPPKKSAKKGKNKDKRFHVESHMGKPISAGTTDYAQASGKSSCLTLPVGSSKKSRSKGKPHCVGEGGDESKKNCMESMDRFLDPDFREGDADVVGSAASQACNMTSINGKMSLDLNRAKGMVVAGENSEHPSKMKEGYNGTVVEQHHVNERISPLGVHLKNKSHPIEATDDQYHTLRNAWVLCDDCQKWRRIPAALADQIEETDCGWTCKDNMDKEFADCSVPQEKSDSEINEELELSDGSCEEDAGSVFLNNQNESKLADQPSWWPIKSNLFLHRKRKTQTIDEVMVCHCKPPSDGRMGCGTKCLNRMLNIECVRGTCPCGNLCSNQQFQKRAYSKLKWIRCGKKGYGLQALEDISEGRFLIEYVGEVLDMHTYEARQREYAMKGHRHFYFMTLNGSEVIDACAKGNLGRFINHSCEPNCRTEKWMVNGEVCVGLFALKDIKKGEEVTFDYNYVRVFGAAAKKCICGSAHCRGYIGGDPTNTELVVQDDSDEEYRESAVIYEDKNIGEQATERAVSVKKSSMKSRSSAAKSVADPLSTEKIDDVTFTKSAVSLDEQTLELKGSSGQDVAAKAEELDRKISEDSTHRAEMKVKSQEPAKTVCSSPQPTDFSPSLSVALDSKRGLGQSPVVGREEPERLHVLTKTTLPSLPFRKKLKKPNAIEINKLNAPVDKSKNILEFSLNGHFEAVEQTLNELLDPEGGISKRKDASRGYLKLLFLTAASESSGDGEALQSNRNLSMILDALLKTKSRSVLVDIINKNGMQMLHNIMKRYRKEFIKTPILRKLLKVLEYLAMRDILTLEHIIGGPPCPGVESFKDSVLTLTEHADKQVHQIARSFRDRWIPKHLRRRCHINRDEGRIQNSIRSVAFGSSSLNDKSGKSSGSDLQPTASGAAGSAIPADMSSLVRNCATDGTRIRKRKSRWDCPAEDFPKSRIRTSFAGEDMNNVNDIPPGFSSCHETIFISAAVPVAASSQGEEAAMDVIPPGFSSPCNPPTMVNETSMLIKNALDSRILKNLSSDAKLNTEEDLPPGFSSLCRTPVGGYNLSSASVGLPDREECSSDSLQLITSDSLACEEWRKSYDVFSPGFSSAGRHLVPPGTPAPDTNHQQCDPNIQQHPNSGATTERLSIDDDDDAPPGFSSPCKGPSTPTPVSSQNLQEKEMHIEQDMCNSVCGEAQMKFNADLPLSYGVPYSAIQLFGVRKDENWITAPGLPFHPYPPLTPSACSSGDQADLEDARNSGQCTTTTITYRNGENCNGACSMDPPKKYVCVESNRQDIHQGYSNKLGRKFFRQQKGNQPKLPPWVRIRNGWSNAAARNGFQ